MKRRYIFNLIIYWAIINLYYNIFTGKSLFFSWEDAEIHSFGRGFGDFCAVRFVDSAGKQLFLAFGVTLVTLSWGGFCYAYSV